MSGNLPSEIQLEIFKRLSVKSLIRFRSVCKAWRSVIDSSHFISHYKGQVQHLLVTYGVYPHALKRKYVLIADDGNFPKRKVSVTFPLQKVSGTLPLMVKRLKKYTIIGCSHGLLCLYGDRGQDSQSRMAVVWNLSIRKLIVVVVPNAANCFKLETILGFGVCHETSDPKIVKVGRMNRKHRTTWQVDVFTLSTGVWRNTNGNLPGKSIQSVCGLQVVVEGSLYWLATNRISSMDGGFKSYNSILSFDVTNEVFKDINLPDSLAHYPIHILSLSKLRDTLVVLVRYVEANESVIDVWMMEDVVSKSFIKLLTVNTDKPYASVRGFRRSGEPIIGTVEGQQGRLLVYKPYSKHIDYLGIDDIDFSVSVHPYVETLLLHNQLDLIVYNDLKVRAKNKRLSKNTSKV